MSSSTLISYLVKKRVMTARRRRACPAVPQCLHAQRIEAEISDRIEQRIWEKFVFGWALRHDQVGALGRWPDPQPSALACLPARRHGGDSAGERLAFTGQLPASMASWLLRDLERSNRLEAREAPGKQEIRIATLVKEENTQMSARTPETEPLLTPAEVATMFRVDPKTVTRWAKAGKLTSIRTLGGHRRYRETEVRALLAGIPQQRSG